MQMKKDICAVVLLTGLSTYAWGTTETLNFAKCEWGFTTENVCNEYGYYSADGYAIFGESVRLSYWGTDYYGVLLCKNNSANIILPSIPARVTRIDVTAYSVASVDANISLYVNGALISTQNIGRGSVYWTGKWASGSVIKLQNDDDKTGNHTQIASVTITHDGSQQGGSLYLLGIME